MIDSFKGKYEALSNFSHQPVLYDNVMYPTSEHAFQAAKTLNQAERRRIASLASPQEAKRAGRKVQLRSDWESVKFDVMVDILRDKFSDRNVSAKSVLISTGDEELVEGNTWHDNCWGDCRCAACKSIVGQNLLGKALMLVRSEIMS